MANDNIINRPPYSETFSERRLKVGDRDNWICQLCLEPIKYLVDSTLDHIIPKSKGGKNELKNLQIAHKKCNSIKGDSLESYPASLYKQLSKMTRKERAKKIKSEILKIAPNEYQIESRD